MKPDDDLDFDIDTEALLKTFRVEVDESLAEIEEALLVLEREPGDADSVGVIFRLVHSIKGNAYSFGFTGLTELTHRVEGILDQVRQGSLPVTSDMVTFLLQSIDAIRSMLERSVAGSVEMQPADRKLFDALNFAGIRQATVREEGEPAATTICNVGAVPNRQTAATLRVDIEKLDRLMNLAGELTIARGRLTQMMQERDFSRDELLETHGESDLLYMELQELVMELRTVPVGPIFRQQMRAVRDLAHERGKLARLELAGQDVEVDTSVVEHLRDPLTHLIRNAVDHGIEPPEARRAAGKAASGLLRLDARHERGTIVIQLADDGAGLNRERILRRAMELGLVREGKKLSGAETDQLIFQPGVSTAEHVTDVSGRGVGMDVVRRNIEALRGSVDVASRPGRGTVFTLRLPLTLAIMHGFHVGVDGETYIIPIDVVVETVPLPGEESLRGNGGGVISLRGAVLPWMRLRELLRLPGRPAGRESIVVVRLATGQIGLVVDELLGESQTVIKPLAKLLRGLPGISGSTILGNGIAAFILDVDSLLRHGSNGGLLYEQRAGEDPLNPRTGERNV